MKKNDFYLIGGLIFLIAVMYFFINLSKTEGSKLIITVDGKEHKILPLDKDTTYTIEHEDGNFNTLEIKDGHVGMVDASCPDKICVKHHTIHNNNESITCLPNNVVLRVLSDEESDMDAISR
ncbi:MAG: NusG domain II-containing protein [Clostridiales bacterium]|nr:NusG domain II-containing protein [Clostridiales bacterium]